LEEQVYNLKLSPSAIKIFLFSGQ